MILSDNGISKVWQQGVYVYKQQPKFLTDNEIWCLKTMYPGGHVPFAEQVDMEVIRLEFIYAKPVTNLELLDHHFKQILEDLERFGIRHGDLTEKNILIRDNHPYVIDWSESRLTCDPRPDKRREGDKYWLKKVMEGLRGKINGS